jgi:hypothetical protein
METIEASVTQGPNGPTPSSSFAFLLGRPPIYIGFSDGKRRDIMAMPYPIRGGAAPNSEGEKHYNFDYSLIKQFSKHIKRGLEKHGFVT